MGITTCSDSKKMVMYESVLTCEWQTKLSGENVILLQLLMI